eukprot:10309004-Prorocentrum_lima.AAC.1
MRAQQRKLRPTGDEGEKGLTRSAAQPQASTTDPKRHLLEGKRGEPPTQHLIEEDILLSINGGDSLALEGVP